MSAFIWNVPSVCKNKTQWPHQISDRQLKCNGTALHWGFKHHVDKLLNGQPWKEEAWVFAMWKCRERTNANGGRSKQFGHILGVGEFCTDWMTRDAGHFANISHWSYARMRQRGHQLIYYDRSTASCIATSPDRAKWCFLSQLSVSSLFHKAIQ